MTFDTVFEKKLQAFMEAQILIEDDQPDGLARLEEAVKDLGSLPDCSYCNAPITDPRTAWVMKDSFTEPSRLMHQECGADHVNRRITVLKRGGQSARALRVDML